MFSKKITADLVNSWEYLTYVVKESLRIDPPTIYTIPYEALEDWKICDVELKKGSHIMLNIGACHFNPVQWHEPNLYIPDRFDPESNYYTKPGSQEPRDACAFLPFSFGQRACPGSIYAMLWIKTMLSFFLWRVEYSIPQKFLDKKNVHFGLDSDWTLEVIVESVKK